MSKPRETQIEDLIRAKNQYWRERSIEQLRKTLSMLTHYVWYKRTRPGEHMWSIPVDFERDFDCILGDAIDELEALRSALLREAAPPTCTVVELKDHPGNPVSARCILSGCQDWPKGGEE